MPRKLYVEQVLPTLSRFLAGYSKRDMGLGHDLERARRVADLLLNLPDYIYREPAIPPTLAPFKDARDYRERRCWIAEPNYVLACDFANAWKHRTISRNGKSIQGIENAQETYAVCRFRDETGVYYRTLKLVLLRVFNGRADLRRILVAACRYWARELAALGLIPLTPDRHFYFTEYIARDDKKAAKALTFHAYEQEPIHVEGICLDFDHKQGRLVYVTPGISFNAEQTINFKVHSSPFKV